MIGGQPRRSTRHAHQITEESQTPPVTQTPRRPDQLPGGKRPLGHIGPSAIAAPGVFTPLGGSPPVRDQVIAPILAGIRSPKMGRKPAHWTRVDRDYEQIRIDMHTLFTDLAIDIPLAA